VRRGRMPAASVSKRQREAEPDWPRIVVAVMISDVSGRVVRESRIVMAAVARFSGGRRRRSEWMAGARLDMPFPARAAEAALTERRPLRDNGSRGRSPKTMCGRLPRAQEYRRRMRSDTRDRDNRGAGARRKLLAIKLCACSVQEMGTSASPRGASA